MQKDACRVISVCNQKGGVSKSTTVLNLGIGLAREGKKVLIIDNDPQGSLTASLGYGEPDDISVTLATIMTAVINEEEIHPEDGILHHEEGVDLLPGNIDLSALEMSIANVISREVILKEYIDMMREHYEIILIDCMPSLGMLTINAYDYFKNVRKIVGDSGITGYIFDVAGGKSNDRHLWIVLWSAGYWRSSGDDSVSGLSGVGERHCFDCDCGCSICSFVCRNLYPGIAGRSKQWITKNY